MPTVANQHHISLNLLVFANNQQFHPDNKKLIAKTKLGGTSSGLCFAEINTPSTTDTPYPNTAIAASATDTTTTPAPPLVVYKPCNDNYSPELAQLEAALGYYSWLLSGSKHAPRYRLVTSEINGETKAVGCCSNFLHDFKDFAALRDGKEFTPTEGKATPLADLENFFLVLRLRLLLDDNDNNAQNFGTYQDGDVRRLVHIDPGQMLWHMQQADPYNPVSWHLVVDDGGNSRLTNDDLQTYPVLSTQHCPRIWPANPPPLTSWGHKQFDNEMRQQIVNAATTHPDKFKKETLLADLIFLLAPMEAIGREVSSLFVASQNSDLCLLTVKAMRYNHLQMQRVLIANPRFRNLVEEMQQDKAWKEEVIAALEGRFNNITMAAASAINPSPPLPKGERNNTRSHSEGEGDNTRQRLENFCADLRAVDNPSSPSTHRGSSAVSNYSAEDQVLLAEIDTLINRLPAANTIPTSPTATASPSALATLNNHLKQIREGLANSLAKDRSNNKNPSVYHPAAYASLRISRALSALPSVMPTNDPILAEELAKLNKELEQSHLTSNPLHAEYLIAKFSLRLEINKKSRQHADQTSAPMPLQALQIKLAQQFYDECEKYSSVLYKRPLLAQAMVLASRCLREPTIHNCQALANFSAQTLPGRFGLKSGLATLGLALACVTCLVILGACVSSCGIGALGFVAAAAVFGSFGGAAGIGALLVGWFATRRLAADSGYQLGKTLPDGVLPTSSFTQFGGRVVNNSGQASQIADPGESSSNANSKADHTNAAAPASPHRPYGPKGKR